MQAGWLETRGSHRLFFFLFILHATTEMAWIGKAFLFDFLRSKESRLVPCRVDVDHYCTYREVDTNHREIEHKRFVLGCKN